MNGDTADSIFEKLRNFKEEALNTLVEKVFKVPVVKGSFSMTTGELCDWIREIIEKNNLKELVFIWDEFSEYFENNMHHLTGFQQVAELAATASFCLLIVTHKAEGYFSDGDPDKRKILDRFVSPIHISLPENIAFELMHEALKVTDDVDKAAKWEKHRKSLEDRTMQSRSAVSKKIGLTDKDLSNVFILMQPLYCSIFRFTTHLQPVACSILLKMMKAKMLKHFSGLLTDMILVPKIHLSRLICYGISFMKQAARNWLMA